MPAPVSGLEAEETAVRQFEGVAEIVAWSTFLITYMHLSLEPSFIAYDEAVFALFAAAFAIFAYQYRMRPHAARTFTSFYRSSLVNAVLLAAVGHMTGGLQSPYNWFFVFILFSGSISPVPSQVLVRLGVIIGYYAFETTYFAYHGFFTREVAVNHLMTESFILGLTGMYAYHLSISRKAFDAHTAAANEEIRAALAREREAAALAERQAADIALAKERDEAMLASLADAVIGFDASGLITSLNPSAEGLLGIAQGDAIGRRLRDLLHIRQEDDPDFSFGRYMDTALNGDAIPFPENVYLERGDGRKTYVTGVVLPLLGDARKASGLVVTLSDITYTREVDQMKTGFLSVAAHQLRTPLSTIRWYLELLNDPSEGKLKKNQKMFAENAYLSLRKMVGLVNRLLAVTRLEAGRVPFKPEPTDLRAMTRDIVEDLKHKLGERRLDVRVAIPELPTVPLDPTLAREVFTNLIENAVRYTPDDGRISIDAADASAAIVWSVTDTGIGIPKAQQEKIFEKFYRAGNAIEHSAEGSGLGLYLAKFIVNAWGGEISFVSEEGKGSTFRVTVPKAGMRAKEGHVSLNA
jgi:PAS domain S-box-containing protein